MKQIAVFCLTVMLALSLMPITAMATTEYTGSIDDSYAVMLIDEDSGTVLKEQNADETIRPASTTKILTCILALENCSLDDTVDVGSDGDWTGKNYSLLGLKNGEQIVLKDLLYGMMLVSGNDAACAVAVHVAGSMDAFVTMMNAKAQELGMTSSHFANPHGVDNDDHYVTARDMSKLVLYALQNEQFKDIVSSDSYDMPATNVHSAQTVSNTNKLILKDESQYYSYATGVKTGSTPKAGDCLVASATKDRMDLICLFFGDQTNSGADRWAVPVALFKWGFSNFKTIDLATLLEKAEPVEVTVENASASDSGVLEFNSPEVGAAYVTLDMETVDGILNGTDSIVTDIVFNSNPLQAPITKDDVVGSVTYKSANTSEPIYQGSLIASRNVPKLGSEPNVSGATAVEEQTPAPPINVGQEGNGSVWWWLLLPGALIVFLVVRLLTVNQRKRKRFRHRQPHYSYKIKH